MVNTQNEVELEVSLCIRGVCGNLPNPYIMTMNSQDYPTLLFGEELVTTSTICTLS